MKNTPPDTDNNLSHRDVLTRFFHGPLEHHVYTAAAGHFHPGYGDGLNIMKGQYRCQFVNIFFNIRIKFWAEEYYDFIGKKVTMKIAVCNRSAIGRHKEVGPVTI